MWSLLLAPLSSAFTPITQANLQSAVDGYPANQATYGEINAWDTSLVTDVAYLIYNSPQKTTFNEDVTGWDTSSVTSFHVTPPRCVSLVCFLSVDLSLWFGYPLWMCVQKVARCRAVVWVCVGVRLSVCVCVCTRVCVWDLGGAQHDWAGCVYGKRRVL